MVDQINGQSLSPDQVISILAYVSAEVLLSLPVDKIIAAKFLGNAVEKLCKAIEEAPQSKNLN